MEATEFRRAPAGGARQTTRRLQDVLAWFAGVDNRALRESGTDGPFYTALGACALAFSCLSGLMLMVAVAYVTGAPEPWKLWWIAVLWTGVMACAVERLILQMPAKGVWSLLAAAVPRVVISVLMATALSDVAGLKIYEPEINNVLSDRRARSIVAVDQGARRIYTPRVNQAKREIARLQGNERKVRDRVVRYELRQDQAAAAAGVCDTRCQYYGRLAINNRRRLRSMTDRNRGRIAGRRAQIRRLRSESRSLVTERRSAINQQDGLLARVEALTKLQDSNAAVTFQVWLLRLLLVALDLTPLTAKVLRSLTLKDSAYEKNIAGRRAEESLIGEERLENSRTKRSQMQDEQRAKRRRSKWQSDYGDFTGHANAEDDVFDASGASTGRPIEGYSLTRFADSMEDHERRPISVPPVLRRGGLIGLGLLSATVALVLLLSAGGLLLMVLGLIAAATVFAATRGFRSAPVWGLRAIFSTFVAGLVMPVLIVVLNA